jgi:hypothetical protein
MSSSEMFYTASGHIIEVSTDRVTSVDQGGGYVLLRNIHRLYVRPGPHPGEWILWVWTPSDAYYDCGHWTFNTKWQADAVASAVLRRMGEQQLHLPLDYPPATPTPLDSSGGSPYPLVPGCIAMVVGLVLVTIGLNALRGDAATGASFVGAAIFWLGVVMAIVSFLRGR